ncbi:MAG TPA: NAD-dependent epimerase/dehydratase family protein [Gaiellaceae bacterium]|nr:NAD-dependent epimerase/dehydratase family protein [Gaiellaceae bacterium]
MPRALVLGGTGQVGVAVARRLIAAGWEVDLTGRRPPRVEVDGARFLRSDRTDPDDLRAALGAGADLLVDNVCYTADQARLLVPLLGVVGSTVMLSSKAVYVDAAGNHTNSDIRPRFDGPIPETQPTMAPGDMPYDSREGYGANKVAAERVFLDSGRPVTVIRPSKVHGPGAERPREWFFVKRVLDRRPAVLLAHRGEGADHPTAAANIAALIEVVAARPGRRILNCADPDTPNGLQISRVIARHLGHEWEEVLVDGDEPGSHPWDVLPPIVLNMTAAAGLGYVHAGDYATTVAETIDWLVEAGAPLDDEFVAGSFDYAAEDAYLEASSDLR